MKQNAPIRDKLIEQVEIADMAHHRRPAIPAAMQKDQRVRQACSLGADRF